MQQWIEGRRKLLVEFAVSGIILGGILFLNLWRQRVEAAPKASPASATTGQNPRGLKQSEPSAPPASTVPANTTKLKFQDEQGYRPPIVPLINEKPRTLGPAGELTVASIKT